MSHLMKALDADASKPVSGSCSSRIATTEDPFCKSASAFCPPSLVVPSEVDSGSDDGDSGAGVDMMRLNSLKALSRSGTFRIPNAIVSCEDAGAENGHV